MIIYKTTNLINGKIYIGLDTKSDSDYFGSGVLLQKAILKYGVENFKKSVIDSSEDFKELCLKEIFWINFYNSKNRAVGYNIANGGIGGDTLSTHIDYDRIRLKMRLAQLGEKNHFNGKHHTKESKEKMSSHFIEKFKNKEKHPRFGKRHSLESKQKMRKSRIEKGLSVGQNNPMSRTNREKRRLMEAA